MRTKLDKTTYGGAFVGADLKDGKFHRRSLVSFFLPVIFVEWLNCALTISFGFDDKLGTTVLAFQYRIVLACPNQYIVYPH